MPFSLIQGGSSLQTMDTSGTLTTLTLPTGITLDSSSRPRFAIYGRYIIVTNSPSRPITVDPEGVVRVLTPRSPRTKPTLSTGTGALTGTYTVKQTFLVLDGDGNIISESGFGVPSLSGTVTSQALAVAGLDLAVDTVSATRLYRTATAGTVYFPWLDIDGNTATTIEDDLADAALSLIAAPSLGSPPTLVLIAEFRERLWGRGRIDIDYLRYSEAGKMYAWPTANTILIPRLGADDRGITGIIARKESLIVGRQDRLFQVTGSSEVDFRVVKLRENIGIESPDSIVVFRDVAYWLAKDGVYSLSEGGVITCLSDGKVRNWFNSDTYFNRARFPFAVGRVDPIRNKYILLLTNVGDSTENRWVEYDLTNKTWWGPHKTDAFTPSWATTLLDSNSLPLPSLGSSSGFLFKEQPTRTDDTATAIDFDVDTKFHDMNSPDITKNFGQISLLSKIQSAGSLTITPYVGGLNATAGSAITADMTKDRQKLTRIGDGRMFKLNLRNTEVGQDCELFGYETPFFERGRR